MELALTILVMAASIVLIISVVLQDGKSSGLSSAVAGGTDSIFGKSAQKGFQATLQRITVVSAVIFMISVMVASVLIS